MLRDKKDRMWVGTFGGGLNLAVPDEAGDGYHFRRFFTDTYSQRQMESLFFIQTLFYKILRIM